MTARTRRAALATAGRVAGAAATVAVIPAGAALPAVEPPAGTDQHIAWWQERQQLSREIDELEGLPDEDRLGERLDQLDSLIVGTPPTTLEGAAVVAAALLWWQGLEEQTPGFGPIDGEAGGTLARYFLSDLPSDVLRRAGLDAVSG